MYKKFIQKLFIFTMAAVLFLMGCKSDSPVEPAPEGDFITMQNKILGRGINIGNALEAPNEGEWGVTIQADYFVKIKQAGFSSVRLPVRWSAHAATTSPYKIDSLFMERVDWAVRQARNNGLAVIINMHHYEELFSSPESERARFVNLWQQIAEHFSTYDNKLFFEILNEPNGNLTAVKWNTFLADAIYTIRVTNPSRTLLAGTAEWGGFSTINQLSIPQGEKNILVTVHYYQPFQFTHQGAEWVQGSNAWLGTAWYGNAQDLSTLAADFKSIVDWSKRTGVPVNLGEFGSYYKADSASRLRWTAAVRAEAEKNGMSWCYWEFCAGFGIYDRNTGMFNNGLLTALIPPA